MYCPMCGIPIEPSPSDDDVIACSCGARFRMIPDAGRPPSIGIPRPGRRKPRTLPIVTTEGPGFAETIERPEDAR